MNKPNPSKRGTTTRRNFIKSTAVLAGGAIIHPALAAEAATATPRQATGVKVGEVTDTSAILWTRLTAKPERVKDGVVLGGKFDRACPVVVNVPVDQIEGACPGAPGRIRIRYGLRDDLSNATETAWIDVTEARLQALKEMVNR